jgi:Concanavalin A-like lectin/glucanases superfamily/K319L-like, PKD domain
MLNTFIKTYGNLTYRQVTLVRHTGVVIALAMDQDRRIFYSILDLQNKEIKSPLDVDFWFANPRRLYFSNEIAEVGVGVADQTLLPTVKQGSRTPVPADTKVRDDEKDFFLSSTARFTEDAPFQAMSDGRHIYIFRQSIAADHDDNVIQIDGEGDPVKDAGGHPVKLVDNTLLVDRFVLSGTDLQTKREVRFQRSRSKTNPQSRKDTLGAKDMDDNPFFEPTQKLHFVRHLVQGRFTALLLPTRLPNVQRWQIFAHNGKTGLIDAYNVQRSDDGLFDTRGTQETSSQGQAASAVDFADGNAWVELAAGVPVGPTFTQEAWIYPRSSASATTDQALLTEAEHLHATAPSVWIAQGRAIRAGFGAGGKWYEMVTGALLRLDQWNHLAVVFDGETYRVYLDGEERFRTQTADIYLNGQLQPDKEPFKGKVPGPTGIRYFGAKSPAGGSLQGIIDEIRLWNRPRSRSELKNDGHVRLTGLEPGLVGYWRFDEASSTTIYDQTDNGVNGTLSGGQWVRSDAPLGENDGLRRDRFAIDGRRVATGLAALLYYQQESDMDANGDPTKPLKRGGRVMLAVGAQTSPPANPEIATVDFGVSNMGRLAQAPDNLQLQMIQPAASDGLAVDERLQKISELEQQRTTFFQEVVTFTKKIENLKQIDAILKLALSGQPYGPLPDGTDPELKSKLGTLLQDLDAARGAIAEKKNTEQSLANELANASVRFYEHSDFRGRSIAVTRGYLTYAQLNQAGFNDIISSIRIPRALQVTAYQDAKRGGITKTFSASTGYVGDDFNDIISCADVDENENFAIQRDQVAQDRQAAQNNFSRLTADLSNERTTLIADRIDAEDERSAKQSQANSAGTQLRVLQGALGDGVSVTMPLLSIDPFGLSVSGGVLGFAWTRDTPLLFDSATGKVAMYFRGTDDQFFVCYYNTATQRAQYPLLDEQGNRCVVSVARSTEPEMDNLEIKVRAGSDEQTCTVQITGAGMEETWQDVPRAPEPFARVLNGNAGQRAYVGTGKLETQEGRIVRLKLAQGQELRRSVEKGAVLRAGDLTVRVREAAARGATSVAVDGTAINPPTEDRPFFYFAYDYAGLAHTSQVAGDLASGSLLVRIATARSDGRIRADQDIHSGSTLVSQWTAALPGHTLAFDGEAAYAGPPDNSAADLQKFAAAGDVSLEAWIRPRDMDKQARLLQHVSTDSRYTLGLRREPLYSALRLDGQSQSVQIPNERHLNFGGVITIEAWIRPVAPDRAGVTNIVAHGHVDAPAGEVYLRIVRDTQSLRYQIGSWNGADHLAAMDMPDADKGGDKWVHLAGVYDGAAWRLYRNGTLAATQADAVGALPVDAGWAIGSRAGHPERLFTGGVDEVRIWRRARTAEEIEADRLRRLGGNEADLVGYWRFDDGAAQDFSRYRNHGTVQGNPQRVSSPLPAYQTFAGVGDHLGDRFLQTKAPFAGGSWTHLAAVYNQSYAVELDGKNAYLDCGNDPSLDLSGDLTIEVFLQFPGSGVQGPQGLLAKGKIDDGTAEDAPYVLYIDGDGRSVFAFEDTDHGNQEFPSDASVVAPGYSGRIAVTRKHNVETKEHKDASSGQVTGADVEKWYDINFYSGGNTGSLSERGAHRYRGADVGSSNGPLEIGRAFLEGFREARFSGVISQVRIWNVALAAAELGVAINGDEQGLVSWWRFRENNGNVAYDSKSSNHAKFKGNVKWVKNPDWNASRLLLYRDGVPVAVEYKQAADFNAATAPQFTLGALAGGARQDFFQGEMEEVRVWKIARTQEQIQDNIFRRLTGEKEDLIAYYTFDAEQDNHLSDHSFRGNDLKVSGAAYVISTAPIGEDSPQVRSALAGLKTPFNGLVQSRPAVQEYGDIQYDIDGSLVGVLKRCYAYIRDGQWHLITGFKVGNLVTEWIGQVQFAPELKGYIEGAPPVPSENLTSTGYVLGEFTDYTGASEVDMVEAQKTSFTYSGSRDSGIDTSLEVKLGVLVDTQVEVGVGVVTKAIDIEGAIGAHIKFESTRGWQSEARAGTGLATTKISKIELRGFVENTDGIAYPYPKVGRRFVPDNMGFALVQSETADVFALRLAHSDALVAYQMRPNPDIPKDWNIISFPINRVYTKQGTLDGKVGLDADPDYPNALNYSPDASYFKPMEAYALKNRIQLEEEAVRVFYEQYSESVLTLGTGSLLQKLPAVSKRNLVNTYVWTSDGGQFDETQETIEIQQESSGSSYSFKAMAGIYTELKFSAGGAGLNLELDALIGGHLDLTIAKSEDSETSFGVNVDIGKVERDIYLRTQDGKLVMDPSDTRRPAPKLWPGKVNAYRFLTFYLEPDTDHFDTFFGQVVDPIWLEQSADPNADALRQARQAATKSECWRIFHRVTFVSRILPDLADSTAPPLEKTLKELNIDSNYELIKLIAPFVAGKLTHFAEFAQAIRTALQTYYPELQAHSEAIIQYMSLYYGITEDLPLPGGQTDADPTLPGATAPPTVDAGPEYLVTTVDGTIQLQGALINSPQPLENLLITWSRVNGPGAVVFADAHALITEATFSQGGAYGLRLAVNDGLVAISDDIEVIVNRPPDISAGKDLAVRLHDSAQLVGALRDSGLGDPTRGDVKVQWTLVDGPGTVAFDPDGARLSTQATFSKSGSYRLRLTADNGSLQAADEMVVFVAGRVTEGLQALYLFKEGQGGGVRDLSAIHASLPLTIGDAARAHWIDGGLAVTEPNILRSNGTTAAMIEAMQASNELTVEAWIKPAAASQPGLARIATIAQGPQDCNFILGQRGDHYYAAVRTSATTTDAGDRALAGGQVTADAMAHVVCTRAASGSLEIYIDGSPAAERMVKGTFINWDPNYTLALGNSPGRDGRPDRAWSGEYHLVALYARALTPAEIQQNFQFGADSNLPPMVTAGADVIVNLPDAAKLKGELVDDRLPNGPLQVSWSQADGPTSVAFDPPDQLQTTARFQSSGRYVLRLTASDGELSASDEMTVIVNQMPTIHAGPDQNIIVSESARLQGVVVNPGLGDAPSVSPLKFEWSSLSGPGSVVFTDAHSLETDARFPKYGSYGLQLSVDNGRLPPALARIAIHVNQAPVIRAVADAIVALPADATLTGSIVDSGLADPAGIVTPTWEQVAGPGEAVIGDAHALATTAHFPRSGAYGFRMTVATSGNDYRLQSTAEVTVTANRPPEVDTGPDQTITLPAPAELEGTVTDDGWPDPPGVVTARWSKASGPGTVAFSDPHAPFTVARFSASGTYVLRLEAWDYPDAVPVNDEVTIQVDPSPRVTDGLLTLFTFSESQGAHVHDGAGSDLPMDLVLVNPGGLSEPLAWLNPGVRINGPLILKAATDAAQLIQKLQQTNAITIEAWVKRAATVAVGEQPARIVTLSVDPDQRNFTLGQTTDEKYVVRLRTTATDMNGINLKNSRQSIVQIVDVPPELCHLVFTRNADGEMHFYLNGVDPLGEGRRQLGGTFGNWGPASDYRLAVGNELTLNRPWLGEVYLVAIYDRALNAAQVRQNFGAGFTS